MKISSASSIIVALISCIGSSNFCSAVSFRGSIKDNTFAFEGEDQEGSQIGNFRSFFANCNTKTQCNKYGSNSCDSIFKDCNKQCKWNPTANNGKGLCENNKPGRRPSPSPPRPGPRPSPPNPRPNPRPSPPPPRPNPRPSPPNPRPNPRPSPPPPRPNPRPSPPPPPRPNPKPSPPPPSQKCYGHESTFYSGHEGCGPGVPQEGRMYLYAVPRCQSVELYDLDKVWGGAHISLGVWHDKDEPKGIAKFNELKQWLANTSQFKTGSSWHPTKSVINPGAPQALNCSNGKGPTWYMVYIKNSKTLDKIHHYIIDNNYATPMGKSDLHISSIQSGSHKTSSLDGIKEVITDSNVDWVVALVKVEKGKDGKTYIERKGEAKILATI